MKFDYWRLQADSIPPFPHRYSIIRPIIRTVIYHKEKSEKYLVLIDSGADYCIFHAQLGEILDIDVKSGKKTDFFGIGGVKQEAYFHSIILKVGGWKYDCYAGFSYDIEKLPYGLLGQAGFFNLFVICFDYTNGVIELKPKRKE